jgi:hypothetical protein
VLLQRIQLQIFQVSVYVESDWPEIIELLRKDFWSYQSSDSPYSAGSSLSLTLLKSDQRPNFPSRLATLQTQNAITFDQDDHRYCDYYGSLYSVINFTKNKAVLCSTDLEKMHEVVSFLILSRVGKILDIQGLHKLHSFAIAYKDFALVCMMPAKRERKALLLEMLKDPDIKMIAEDIPLIDFKGRIYPFLLTMGIDVKSASTKEMKGKIVASDTGFENIMLVETFRSNSPVAILKKTTNLKMLKGLFKYGILGIGSPVDFEYFWEPGPKDFWVKTFIFFRRLKGFISLCLRSKKYYLYAGNDPIKTAQELSRVLKRQSKIP